MFIRSLFIFSVISCVSALGCMSDGQEEVAESASDLTAGGACRGKQAGDPCSLCGPRERDCIETMELKVCTPETYRNRTVLRCRASMPVPVPTPTTYAPCEGKRLGDACTLCAPSDTTCFETQELKICDGDGRDATCTSEGTVFIQ